MVNWHDPALLLNDYSAFVRVNHAVAGLYIWETVLTAGFEIDVLRRKRPYRWTIWLYIGTRYTGLLAFVGMFIYLDVHGAPCQSFIKASAALGYASWAFASLIIALRVLAIWNHNITVSLIVFVVFSCGVALNIRRLSEVTGTYNPIVDSCIALNTRGALTNNLGVIGVDVVLLLAMLIGLLRYGNSGGGIWNLLYQQCIVWIALALIAEIPVVVFIFLNLNDVWNVMFMWTALSVLSIAASRMYRSLADRGSFTEYVSSPTLTVDPQFSLAVFNPAAQRRADTVHTSMHFASPSLTGGRNPDDL